VQRVLIANRGEIAVRIARTLRVMGLESVAIYSDADRTAPHVHACDFAVHVGPPPAVQSYLNVAAVLAAATRMHVDAIHPGYGFLSENAAFARAVAGAGMRLIGPSSETMERMGEKTAARAEMRRAGVPVVPGSDGPVDLEGAQTAAESIGYPLMLKAACGGGGKGMRVVKAADELPQAFRLASSEAEKAFGNGQLYLERKLQDARHVEIQLLCDSHGSGVWLGERECSLQRRHQKVIEESPCVALPEQQRETMGDYALRAARQVRYEGVGTLEFLLAGADIFFLEMNTRLQVEHSVTEMRFGIDLVEEQVRVARGERLRLHQAQYMARGHSIEARLYAESPAKKFLPAPGRILGLTWPQGPGIRVDAGVTAGQEVSVYYDPMIAKITAWGASREQARRRLIVALEETCVRGLETNRRFLIHVLADPGFIAGDYHTGTLEQIQAPSYVVADHACAAVLAAMAHAPSAQETAGSWRTLA
jgi:acetyl/propionyl-CoA carboxylase alpha subunit